MAVERGREREDWIERIARGLPDGDVVTGLLADLPGEFRPVWSDLVASAAKRNSRTPTPRFAQLEKQFATAWEAAAKGERS